jgi:phage terminase large subunit
LAKKHGYRYGAHWAPHDIAVREFSSGMTRKAVAAKLGIHFRALPQQKVNDAIAATKLFIPRCMFDAHGCEHGLMHLRNYKSAPNKSGLWLPVHDEHSHAADAFRYLVAGVNMGNIKPTKMKIIGF